MSGSQAGGAMRPRAYTGRIPIPERFHCEAERRSRRFRVDLEYDDIGADLLELRKAAYDLYGGRCLWNVAGHATIGGMRGIARCLQEHGDLNAALLAIKILETTGWDEFIAP